MTTYHDEVELEDFEYDEEDGVYYYPCPCGDQFEISRDELLAGEEEATCPSCSLVIKVIFDKEEFREKYGSAISDELQERDLDDFEYDEEAEVYSYPCSCGERYQSLKSSLLAGSSEARCPVCKQTLKIAYDKDDLSARFEEVVNISADKECIKQSA